MSQRKTNEQFLEELHNLYGDEIIPLEEYKNAITKIKCRCKTKGHEFEITPNGLLSGKHGCPICSVKNNHEKHKVTLNDYLVRLHKKRPTLNIAGEFNGTKAPVKLQCNVCENIWNVSSAYSAVEGRQSNGGCPYCNGEIIKKGFNSLGDLRPDLVPLFVDKDIPYTIPLKTHLKVDVMCPDCKSIRKIDVCQLTTSGLSCMVCSTNISLPNKIIRNLFILLKNEVDNLDFEYHNKSILGKQSLDVYFEKNGLKYGVEMQGRQHDDRAYKSMYSGTTKTISEYDEDKRNKLKNSGIHEIEIECNYTNMEYIKNKILESEISKMFDLSNIDWNDIFSKCYKSIIKIVCDDFNNGIMIKDIALKNYLSRTTVRDYLKRGRELGWCNYDEKLSLSLGPQTEKRKVEVYDLNNNYEYTFNSLSEAATYLSEKENTKYYSSTISAVCRGKYKYHKKHIFKYSDDI